MAFRKDSIASLRAAIDLRTTLGSGRGEVAEGEENWVRSERRDLSVLVRSGVFARMESLRAALREVTRGLRVGVGVV